MPKISFRNVKKVYPSGTYALDGVSFDVEPGDFVCIIGESGGGKTTLLKLISGLDTATAGEIYFDDEINNYVKAAKRNVAFVFQDYTIYPNMTVFENIMLSLHKLKISYELKYEMVWDIIRKMELEVIQGEVPKHLSYGQCQKVALAKALIRNPQIILFDEPLSNIDSMSKNDYKKLIIEAKRLLPQCTFFYVTHNINDAMELSNKIMVIDNGNILQFDDKQIVFENPANIKVASYILPNCEKYHGKIINNYFLNDNRKIKLTDFQISTLTEKVYDNVICYSLGNINIIYDNSGNLLTGYKDYYYANLTINDNQLTIFNNNYEIDKLKDVVMKNGDFIAKLERKKISFNYIVNSIRLKGEVVYTKNKIIVVKIENCLIPFEIDGNYILGDKLDLFYPIEEIKAIDENGENVISSYIISKNDIKIKVLNSKKGLIKIGKIKLLNSKFIGLKGVINYRLALDDFIFNSDGKFKINLLYNEETLGENNLIHFSCRDLGDYISAKVPKFNLFNIQKINFDIKFSDLSNSK
jgi:ABC-type sugar transport system ATPase subunit